jgi:hypothetical protein
MFRTITIIDKNNLTATVLDSNPKDVIKTDVTLLLRLFEYVKEESVTDEEIHRMTDRLIDYSKDKVVTMDCYEDIIGSYSEPSVMTEKTMLFRMDSRTLWSRFTWSPLNYSIALNNEVEGLDQIEQRIYRLAKRIGDFTKPYYNDDVGENISNGLTEFGRIGVAVMTDLKAGIPIDGTKERWDASVETLSTYLDFINPEYWNKAAVKSYLDALVQLWIDSISTRNNKDFDGYETIVDSIEVLMISGSEDVTSFADVFSAGIISQFPEKFTE